MKGETASRLLPAVPLTAGSLWPHGRASSRQPTENPADVRATPMCVSQSDANQHPSCPKNLTGLWTNSSEGVTQYGSGHVKKRFFRTHAKDRVRFVTVPHLLEEI